MSENPVSEFSVIGKDIPMIDSRAKVTGEAMYIEDLKMPGMLSGKILRSPIPHGKILHIDTSRAGKINGVKAVVTAKDAPSTKFGLIVSDELILAGEKVRYVGDEIAAVAAVDRDIAEEALSQIRVEYEPLPAVYDPEEAMTPGAPLIHDAERNIATQYHITRGDFSEGLRSADFVLEDEFEVPFVHQAYMEPVGSVASFDSYGILKVWVPFQKIFWTRNLLSKALIMPIGRIHVVQSFVGGGFGGKIDQKVPAVAALLSLKTRRPVQIVNTRDEEFKVGRSRVAAKIHLTMGINKEGTVVAKKARIFADNGAYCSLGPTILNTIAIRHDNAYRFQNLETEAYLVYTNKVPTSAFRGYGSPQITFAVESMLDMLAEKAGVDPIDVRLKNATRTDDVTVHGWKIRSCGLGECIEKATKAIQWEEKKKKKTPHRGLGLACMIHVSGNRGNNFDGSSAIMKLNFDGNFDLIIGEGDIGQGARTVFTQIAAEVLGVRCENINVSVADTGMTPFCLGASASRVTFVGGNAVKAAALAVRKRILELASEMLEASQEDLIIEDGRVFVKGSKEKGKTLGEIAFATQCRRGGQPIMEKGTFDAESEMPDPKTRYGSMSGAYPFGAHAAEVEVDVETGKVKILDYVAAHDLGRTINPMAARGQIIGGVAQGIGYALREELVYKEGNVVNPSFADYKIPSAQDMPPIKMVLVETIDPNGPFGAKGLGEPTLVPVAPAIANAIYDAVGVRLKTLPMTPEKILEALEKKRKQ